MIHVVLLCLFALLSAALSQFASTKCGFGDLACHLGQFRFQPPQYRQQQLSGSSRQRSVRNCNYQELWLIPGRADTLCTRPNAKRLIDIDPRQVSIYPPIIRFPGCFTIEIKNIHIRENNEVLANSLFAKSEYQWLNVREFGDTKCQNVSSNGCGGHGNNCYYCDICESLKEIGRSSNKLSEQLAGLNCPRRAGYYTFRKEFCFNDWSSFDADGDCQLDFITSDKSDIKSALASLQQVGYGTIVAKIHLATNATQTVEQKKSIKEAQIESAAMRELEERRATWDITRGQFDKFRQWYVDYRKNIWHREEYLPWLLYENELGCIRLTFDICERTPRQKLYGGQGYTCD